MLAGSTKDITKNCELKPNLCRGMHFEHPSGNSLIHHYNLSIPYLKSIVGNYVGRVTAFDMRNFVSTKLHSSITM